MTDLRELEQAKAVIESFAPKRPRVSGDKPYRIGSRQVVVWGIPVAYVASEQLIEVRKV